MDQVTIERADLKGKVFRETYLLEDAVPVDGVYSYLIFDDNVEVQELPTVTFIGIGEYEGEPLNYQVTFADLKLENRPISSEVPRLVKLMKTDDRFYYWPATLYVARDDFDKLPKLRNYGLLCHEIAKADADFRGGLQIYVDHSCSFRDCMLFLHGTAKLKEREAI